MKNQKLFIVLFFLIFLYSCDSKIHSFLNESLIIKSEIELIFIKGNSYGLLKPEFEKFIINGSKIVGSDDIEILDQKINIKFLEKIYFKIKDNEFSAKGYRINIDASIISNSKLGDIFLYIYLPNIPIIQNSLDKTIFFPSNEFNANENLVKIATVNVHKNKTNMYFAIFWKWGKPIIIILGIILVILIILGILSYFGIEIEVD